MDPISIIGIAVALSLDAFAVSVANGSTIRDLKIRHAVRMALSFGLFQAVMPVLGWSAGHTVVRYIQGFDHWVAFGLLLVIGVKMLWESRSMKNESAKNCLHFPTLMILSFATSIDALAVGIGFAMLEVSIIAPVLIIGLVTFVICLVGTQVGSKIGHLLRGKVEFAGGIILVLIGIKIVLEHVCKSI